MEAGKQIGISLRYIREDELCWLCMGAQKWQGIYKFYYAEILERNMVAEEYICEELTCCASFEELVEVAKGKSAVSFRDMAPLRGQRIFNPNFVCE